MENLEEFFESAKFEEIARTDFEKYDKDGSGFIEVGELRTSIQELSDELEKIKPGAGWIKILLNYSL